VVGLYRAPGAPRHLERAVTGVDMHGCRSGNMDLNQSSLALGPRESGTCSGDRLGQRGRLPDARHDRYFCVSMCSEPFNQSGGDGSPAALPPAQRTQAHEAYGLKYPSRPPYCAPHSLLQRVVDRQNADDRGMVWSFRVVY